MISNTPRTSRSISVIIPALNEARTLPRLMSALAGQTLPPSEIIVADGGSTDGTQEVASAHGAFVVPGGRPGTGRNAGAAAASSELLLFLDADVLPRQTFLEDLLYRWDLEGLDVATCFLEPLSDRPAYWLLCQMTNLFMQTMQSISPHAPGCCILVRRAIHDAIGGFDERLAMAEDHDYVNRAVERGVFGVIPTVSLPISVRRLEREGLVRLSAKYLYCELHALAGRPIQSVPFVYEYGESAYDKSVGPGVDISWIRRRIGQIENPLSALSERGNDVLRRVSQAASSSDSLAKLLHRLIPSDRAALESYLKQRLKLLTDRSSLASFMQSTTNGLPRERLRLPEIDWEKLRERVGELGSETFEWLLDPNSRERSD